MKNILYKICLVIFVFSSCKRFDGAIPPTPPCDNTTSPLTVSLNWAGTFYYCTSAVFGGGNATPPNATAANYMGYASATGGVNSLSAPLSYLCAINVANAQQIVNPDAPCTGPGVGARTWATPGPTQLVYRYTNAPTRVSIDYYDICGQCSSSSPASARPHFMGMAILPKDAQSQVLIQMRTQDDYTSINCQ